MTSEHNAKRPAPKTVDEIRDMAACWQRSRALLAAFELDLFTHVGSGATSGEIALRAGTDHRCTDRLLNACVAIGVLNKVGDVFHNTEAGETCLMLDGVEYLAGLKHAANTFKNWATLDEAVRRGSSVVNIEWDTDEKRANFIEAMHSRARATAGELMDRLDLSSVRRVLDVGGGSGVYSMAMCRANPEISAVVLDLPTVVPLTEKYVEREGLADRIHVQEGDYHEVDFGGDYDLVFLSAIVHINSAGENRSICNRAFKALNPGGRIAIQDFIVDEDRISPERSVLFALNMITSTNRGDTYTESEVRQWLFDAGFDHVERDRDTPTSMIVGKKT